MPSLQVKFVTDREGLTKRQTHRQAERGTTFDAGTQKEKMPVSKVFFFFTKSSKSADAYMDWYFFQMHKALVCFYLTKTKLHCTNTKSIPNANLYDLSNWLIKWCFTPLSAIFQSYHSYSSRYSCLSWVSPELGWGSEVSCPRTLLKKTKRI